MIGQDGSDQKLMSLDHQILKHPARSMGKIERGLFCIMGKMESADKAMVESIGLIVDMSLSPITVTVGLRFVFIQPRMYPLNAKG